MLQTVAHSYAFINLSNGIEAFLRHPINESNVRFLRIQSTACEQKLWEQILRDLSPDFLLLAAMGRKIIVYDYGANKDTPRSVWQGLEWIKYAIIRRWTGEQYIPEGRAAQMKAYFEEQYQRLSKSTKAMLDYYKTFFNGDLNISSITSATLKDGDKEYYRSVLSSFIKPDA